MKNAWLSFAKKDKYPIRKLLYNTLCLNIVGPTRIGLSTVHNFIRHFETTQTRLYY